MAHYVYRCNAESEWYQIHDSIIRKVSSRYSHIGSNTGKIHFACRLKGIVQQKIIRMNTMSCHSKPV